MNRKLPGWVLTVAILAIALYYFNRAVLDERAILFRLTLAIGILLAVGIWLWLWNAIRAGRRKA